ncbi:hypothetical protein IscW_ISCW011764 [Ixodes scapularis]|uniref:Uncharacterized protein n=1 Tax=Ixodes scapularis TaxID=6945 RepID=B7Q742_IXOSC|nr:hypothetical protein IscW_ISCW011764 [Ixodes scapularis]|eukprot:XP_002412093.1 hypothetical protein IscW_ISCW011764 [Ixodes scapularis]
MGPEPAPSRKATQPCSAETTGHGGPQPARVPEARENPESLIIDFDPSLLLRFHHHLAQTHPPLSSEEASAASSSEATSSVPAASDSSQDADLLDSNSKRLVIVEGDGDVTPG